MNEEFSKYYFDQLVFASRNCADPYLDTIKYFPPLLASLPDRANNTNNVVPILKSMRKEYQEIRLLRQKYTSSILEVQSVGEKRETVKE